MFGFRRRKSQADDAIDIMDEAIGHVTERWLYFCDAIPFGPEVPLEYRITSFSVPMIEGLQKAFPVLKGPESALLIFVVKGIERSGTHPVAEIYEALGMPPLPG